VDERNEDGGGYQGQSIADVFSLFSVFMVVSGSGLRLLGGGFQGVSGELGASLWLGRNSGVDMVYRDGTAGHGVGVLPYIYCVSVYMLLERM